MTLLIARSAQVLTAGHYLSDMLGLASARVLRTHPTPFRRYRFQDEGLPRRDVIATRKDRLRQDVAGSGFPPDIFTMYCVFGDPGEFDLFVKSENIEVNAYFDREGK